MFHSKNGSHVIFCFLRFCYGVFRSKNGSRVLFCSLFDSVGVVLGLRLLLFLCLFWLCFARVSRSLNKNGLKIFECFGSAWFGVKGSAVSVLCLFLFLCACFRFYSYKLFMTVLGWFCVCRCSVVDACLLPVLV